MRSVSDDLWQLGEHILDGDSVTITENGKWKLDGRWTRFVRWLFRRKEKHQLKIYLIICRLFDQLEERPIYFGEDNEKALSQVLMSKSWNFFGETVLHALNGKISTVALKSKIVALKYRSEKNGGGVDKELSTEELKKELFALAEKWKKSQPLFAELSPELLPVEEKNLEDALLYPEFVTLLISEKALQNDFFKWTIANAIPPQAFIEYPAIAKRLKRSLLVGRIGRFAYQNVLSIEKGEEKVLTLPFNGKKVSILDPKNQVSFRGGVTTTVGKVFKDIQEKNLRPGMFEFIGKEGFRNWNAHKLGYFDVEKDEWEQVNLDADNWWESLPVEEVIDKETLLSRYDWKEIEDDQWLILGRGARQSTSYNIDDCHGYTGVLIPDGHGKWRVYDFGKYALKWPQGMLGGLGVVGNTVKAAYTYPDSNIYYSSFRQQAAYRLVCSQEEGVRYMEERVKRNIMRGWLGKLYFMLGFENCAFSPQTDLEAIFGKKGEGGLVPNLFLAHVLTAGAKEPLGTVFRLVKKAPKSWQDFLVTICEKSLLSFRGVKIDGKKISLSRSSFANGCELVKDNGEMESVRHYIYLPSYIFDRKDVIKWVGQAKMQVAQ